MIRYVAPVLAGLMFAFVAWAQTSPAQHQHVAPNLIDGAVHPELIPDSTAYRLYLAAVSTKQNPTEAEQKGQLAKVTRTGLSDTDQRLFLGILADFRAKYDALVAGYNDSAKAAAARNETVDVRPLLTNLDDLVQSTRDAINARLSPQGAARLNSFVLAEKKNMKVTED